MLLLFRYHMKKTIKLAGKSAPVPLVPLLFFAGFLFSSCATDFILNDFKEANLFGMIYDLEHRPVGNVTITIDGDDTVFSDINGRFVIPRLKKGSHSLYAGLEGYETLHIDFSFDTRTQILYLKMVSARQLLKKGETELKQGKLETAYTYIRKAMDMDPDNSEGAYLLAVISFKRGEYERAVEILADILCSGYEGPFVSLFLADIYEFFLHDDASAAVHLSDYLYKIDDPSIVQRFEKLKKGNRGGGA